MPIMAAANSDDCTGTLPSNPRLDEFSEKPKDVELKRLLARESGLLNDTEATWSLNDPLSVADPEVYALIHKEKDRQKKGLEMIASENFTSMAVLDCLSSCLHNKYSEGMPKARYYGGNEYIDEIEILAQHRSIETFKLSTELWGVNVQPYSGSPANFAVYTALVEPHGRIMGLDLPDGGHLTHGFFTAKKKVSATSVFFESMPYKVDPKTGLIDYDELERTSKLFRPKLIVAGVSCYTRNLDYERFRKIANDCGAYLMADMAHIAGLIAAGVVPSPFPFCDVVTSTVHKTLRGPRAGIIFFRKGVYQQGPDGKMIMYDFEEKINNAVFPGLQGGPHNMAVAGIAVAMKHAQSIEFQTYQKHVIKNAKALAAELQKFGYTVVTGGTDNHIVLVDMSPLKLSGAKSERILEMVAISVNKNTVPGDKSAMNPSGIRIGLPPLTTRGIRVEHISTIAGFMHKAFQIALDVQKVSGPKLVDWRKELDSNPSIKKIIQDLKNEVEAFAEKFPLPGKSDL